MSAPPRNVILGGDALRRLRQLPNGCIDCAITSPPYPLGLRDYGHPAQRGREPHVEEWVGYLREVLSELARVVKPWGSVWLNLGDCYSRDHRAGAPPKSLLAAPERLLLAAITDGWRCRNKAIWAKTNPLPHPAADRLSTTYEVLYLLTRSGRYFFDLDAIRVPHRTRRRARPRRVPVVPPGPQSGLKQLKAAGRVGHPAGKNPGDVWWLGKTTNYSGHPAPFPEALIRRPLLASCPAQVCTGCRRPVTGSRCRCNMPTRPGVVIDPFFGSGTVGAVAQSLGRDWVGIELNPAYVALARNRLDGRGRRAA